MKKLDYLSMICLGVSVIFCAVSNINQSKDIDLFLLENHLHEMKLNREIDSLYNECFKIVDKRLDRIDSLLLEK